MATLERWRAEALGTARTERIWTATARLEAVIATAALDETARSAGVANKACIGRIWKPGGIRRSRLGHPR